jgi:DNA-binding CsgD family transcriptional regulator
MISDSLDDSLHSIPIDLLDEIDYGVLLVQPGLRVVFANRAGRQRRKVSALVLGGDWLTINGARCGSPATAELDNAIRLAIDRRFRRLVVVGRGTEAVEVAVVPLPGSHPRSGDCALLLISRSQVCQQLSAYWFARNNRLTHAESRVLDALCDGHEPLRIAEMLGIQVCTVRTHLNTIRAKTGAHSIRGLVQHVAQLPPLTSATE